MSERIDRLKPNPFLDGPTDHLVKGICNEIAKVPQFKKIFGESIEPYDREDFAFSALPALRVYNLQFIKEQESHYINGRVYADVIFPASLRRGETEELQNIVASALLQQFRRPGFFAALREVVPGLNELGKVFEVDKTMGLKTSDWDGVAPMTQTTLNFRIDLKEWDSYLESQGRTKADPFEQTLLDLERIVSEIDGIKNSAQPDQSEVTVPIDQQIGG